MGENSGADTGSDNPASVDSAEEAPYKSLLSRIFGSPDSADSKAVIADSIQRDVASAEAGTREMLVNLRNLNDMRVEDVYVPKADIAAIASDSSFEQVVEGFRTSGMTRLPVYTDTLDTPIGFIHLKESGPPAAVRAAFDADRCAAAKNAGQPDPPGAGD
jgi:magnesium and cobalt transporter